MAQCTAKSKQSGKRCKRHAAKGSDKCKMHGGKSPGAPIKHGRYSKYAPKKLLEKYEENRAAGDLSSLHDEIALVQAMIANKLETIELENCEESWQVLKMLAEEARVAEGEDLAKITRKMIETIDLGAAEFMKLRGLLGLFEDKRKLSDTELKRERIVAESITAREALTFAAQLKDAVFRVITDAGDRAAISREFAAIVGRGSDSQPGQRDVH